MSKKAEVQLKNVLQNVDRWFRQNDRNLVTAKVAAFRLMERSGKVLVLHLPPWVGDSETWQEGFGQELMDITLNFASRPEELS